MASNALLVFIHRSNALHRWEIEMGHADEGVLSAHYERQLADVRADLAYHKNRADRAQFAQDARDRQIGDLIKRADHWQAKCLEMAGKLGEAQGKAAIADKLIKHLADGDGTYVLCEHSPDGLVLVFCRDADRLRNMLLRDAHAVSDGMTLEERTALLDGVAS